MQWQASDTDILLGIKSILCSLEPHNTIATKCFPEHDEIEKNKKSVQFLQPSFAIR